MSSCRECEAIHIFWYRRRNKGLTFSLAGDQEREIASLKRELEMAMKVQKEASAAAEEEKAMRRAAERRAIDSTAEDSGYAKALEVAHQERDRALSKLSDATTKLTSMESDLQDAKRNVEQHLAETRRLEALVAKVRRARLGADDDGSVVDKSSKIEEDSVVESDHSTGSEANYKKELESARSAVTALQQSLNAKTRAFDEVEAELAQLQMERQKDEDRVSSKAQEEIRKLRKELAATRKELLEAQERTMQTASSGDLPPVVEEEETKRVEELMQKLAAAQERNAGMSLFLDRERSASAKLKEEHEKLLSKLQAKVRSLEESLAEAKEEAGEAKNTLRRKALAWDDQEAALKSDIAKAQQACDALKSYVFALPKRFLPNFAYHINIPPRKHGSQVTRMTSSMS